jgi:hypothetical protein
MSSEKGVSRKIIATGKAFCTSAPALSGRSYYYDIVLEDNAGAPVRENLYIRT